MNPHDGERLLCRLIIHSSALGNYLSDKDKPNVSSDLHEVKITCADSKQASKEPQWIVYSSCSATSMTFALPHWNNFQPVAHADDALAYA